MNRTLLLIKPDSVKRNLIGKILSHIIDKEFKVIGMKMVWPTREMAGAFYAIHKGKDFYDWLVDFLSSGPIIAACLEHPEGPAKLREVGATNPEKAAPGTVRNLYGTSMGENAVHASAPDEDPQREIRFFFQDEELFSY
jgi:nucleoside-diphosphate kinase